MRTLVPGYPAVLDALNGGVTVAALDDLFGGAARARGGDARRASICSCSTRRISTRAPAIPIAGPDGRDWPDNAFRFAALCRGRRAARKGLVEGYRPGCRARARLAGRPCPAYLHYAGAPRPGTVMTVHNLAFQGQFPADLLATLGLPAEAFADRRRRVLRRSSAYLKAGLHFADRITTVSPTYAAEIRTPAGGMGLDGLLRARADVLSGILNGIDTTVWDPAHDPLSRCAIRCRPASRGARRTRRRCRNGSGCGAIRRSCCSA